MQFPQPIVRQLVIYDNNGNPVVIIGTGPIIRVINPVSGREISIDPGTTQPIINWWNSAHTDAAFINAISDTQFGINSFTRASTLPGVGNVRPRLFFFTTGIQLATVTSAGQLASGPEFIMSDTSGELRYQDSLVPAISGGAISVDNAGAYIKKVVNNTTIEESITVNSNGVTFTSNVPGAVSIVVDRVSGYVTNTGLASAAWTACFLSSGWALVAGYYVMQARINNEGTVELRGAIAGGAVADGTVLFQTPFVTMDPVRKVMIKPVTQEVFGTKGDGAARVEIDTSGFARCFAIGTSTTLYFDGCNFSRV